MSRFSSDYSKRAPTQKLDLFAFARIPPNSNTPLEMEFPKNGGYVIAGVELAIQRWVKLLLTTRGSVFGDPTAGTEFIPSVMINGGGNEEIAATFDAAVKEIDVYLRLQYEEESTPLDEQVESAILLDNWELSNGRMSLPIQIITRGGVGVEIMVPVEKLQ